MATVEEQILKALEKPTMDPDYRYVLQKFLNTAEPREEEQQQRSIVNEQQIVIEDVDDDDVEQQLLKALEKPTMDPEYRLYLQEHLGGLQPDKQQPRIENEEERSYDSFVRKLKPYVLQAERYGLKLLIKPKEESHVNCGHMKNQEPINQRASQMQPQSVDVNGSTKRKPLFKVGSGVLSGPEHDGMVRLDKKKEQLLNRSTSVADLGNMVKGKAVIELDDVVDMHIDQNSAKGKKVVMQKQNVHADFTPSYVISKVQYERDLRISITAKNKFGRNKIGITRTNQESDPRNNQLPRELSECVEKGQAQSQEGLKKPGARTYSVTKNQDTHTESTQPRRKGKEETLKKLKRVVEDENESSVEFMASSTPRTTKKQFGNNSQVRSGAEGITSKVQNVKAAKSSGLHQNNQAKATDNGNSSDLEILDSQELFEGSLTPFVPSKHRIDVETGSKRSGSQYLRSEFRENVLNAIKKPWDIEEYREHKRAVQVYLNTYPGFQKKLSMHRYDMAKRLILLRGFVFWLQNLTQTGAFQPWNDRECLNVELESG